MCEPHISDEEFKKHWPKLRAEFVLEDSDIEAQRLAGAAWNAAKKQAGQLLLPPQAYKIITTEADGYMVRYAALDQDGPVLVTSWTVVLNDGNCITASGGHGPIPLEEAEALWKKTIEMAKPPEPEPDPGPETLEEAVKLLIEEARSVCGLDDFYGDGDLDQAADWAEQLLEKHLAK